MAEAGEPAPAVFAHVRGVLAVSAYFVVNVGAHPENDVAGGRKAGMRTIRVRRAAFADPGEGEEADAVVEDLAAVPVIARRLLEERA